MPLAKKLSRLKRLGVLATATLFPAAMGSRLATRVYGTVGVSGCRAKRRKPRFVPTLRKAARRVPMFRFEVLTALVPCAAISSGDSGSRGVRAALVFPALTFPIISVQRIWRSPTPPVVTLGLSWG